MARLAPPRADAAWSKPGSGASPADLTSELVTDLLADLSDDLGAPENYERKSLEAALTPAAHMLVSARKATYVQ